METVENVVTAHAAHKYLYIRAFHVVASNLLQLQPTCEFESYLLHKIISPHFCSHLISCDLSTSPSPFSVED